MRIFVGVDLGSTTTKAVVMTASEQILGRGITNSRNNYDVACALARAEALTTARFALLARALAADPWLTSDAERWTSALTLSFRREQHTRQLEALREACLSLARAGEVEGALREVFTEMEREAREIFTLRGDAAPPRSDFFRDLATSQYLRLAEDICRERHIRYDTLVGVFDRSIHIVENDPPDLSFETHIRPAAARVIAERDKARAAADAGMEVASDSYGNGGQGAARRAPALAGGRGHPPAPDEYPRAGPAGEQQRGLRARLTQAIEGAAAGGAPPDGPQAILRRASAAAAAGEAAPAGSRARLALAVAEAAATPLEEVQAVGTGYGRVRLPFPKQRIRSEILCHGLGAHYFFPRTATVLDIGGQDTKAIQVDDEGIVTGFQMNDRCAAGCGRYLGYIADEMNLGVHELGPLAQLATRPVRIASTCTVFAGAELRERLSLGEAREDILAGLHRAIILRAMSLLARSGGVQEEFTFTGGVAKNPAALAALRLLVADNYGARTLNISPDSIYTGAVGAALFARRGAAAGEDAGNSAGSEAA